MYFELILQSALERTEDGIKVNGKLINSLRYTDGKVVITDSSKDFQRLFNRISTEDAPDKQKENKVYDHKPKSKPSHKCSRRWNTDTNVSKSSYLTC